MILLNFWTFFSENEILNFFYILNYWISRFWISKLLAFEFLDFWWGLEILQFFFLVRRNGDAWGFHCAYITWKSSKMQTMKSLLALLRKINIALLLWIYFTWISVGVFWRPQVLSCLDQNNNIFAKKTNPKPICPEILKFTNQNLLGHPLSLPTNIHKVSE